MDPSRTLTEEEVMASFNKIVEKNAGVGMKVADMTEDMVDILETILVKLQEKAEELGI